MEFSHNTKSVLPEAVVACSRHLSQKLTVPYGTQKLTKFKHDVALYLMQNLWGSVRSWPSRKDNKVQCATVFTETTRPPLHRTTIIF